MLRRLGTFLLSFCLVAFAGITGATAANAAPPPSKADLTNYAVGKYIINDTLDLRDAEINISGVDSSLGYYKLVTDEASFEGTDARFQPAQPILMFYPTKKFIDQIPGQYLIGNDLPGTSDIRVEERCV